MSIKIKASEIHSELNYFSSKLVSELKKDLLNTPPQDRQQIQDQITDAIENAKSYKDNNPRPTEIPQPANNNANPNN